VVSEDRQAGIGGFADPPLEALVLSHPFLDLSEQVLGDVDRLGPSVDLSGQNMCVVRLPAGTLAAGIAAAARDLAQGGRDEGAAGGQLLQLGISADLESRHGGSPFYYQYIY